MPSLALLHQWAPRSDLTPPPQLSSLQRNPTLIVSWWCTIYSLVFILIRVIGRWVRAERLFREDKAMLWSMIPLVARMAFVHVILIWGTNNVQTAGLSQTAIDQRSIGSRLVLISRILYAIYIWIAKVTVLEFVKRTIGTSWTKFNERGVRIIYGFLGLTFVGVVISTLAECQPFPHYWQVVPDPGPSCRSGRAQLITMGTCDIVTDVVLMVFPIPVVLKSKMPLKKKVSLCALFLLSLILIGVTAYRMTATIDRHYDQQFRSLLASLEILAATCVANIIAIGSFLRDKGVKKAKFRANSQDESIADNTLTTTRSKVNSIAQHHWGSDDDLVRDLGLTPRPELRHSVAPVHRPAQPADTSPTDLPQTMEPIIAPQGRGLLDPSWTFRRGSQLPPKQRRESDASSTSSESSNLKLQVLTPPLEADEEAPLSPFSAPESPYKRMDFFDVGGLMDMSHSEQSSMIHASRRLSQQQISSIPRSQASFLSDIGGLLGTSNDEKGDIRPATSSKSRKNSTAFSLQSDTRTLSPFVNSNPVRRTSSSQPSQNGATQHTSHGATGPDTLNISDAGGLLS